jgi:hypothetical protein
MLFCLFVCLFGFFFFFFFFVACFHRVSNLRYLLMPSQTIAILSGVSGPDELPTLQSWLKNNPAQAQQLLRHIPSLISCCRSITSYFPQASLPRLPVIETSKDEAAILSVSLPRRHVHCLLAHMFFCTAKYPTGAVKWWGDFSPWYTTDMGPSEAFVASLVLLQGSSTC